MKNTDQTDLTKKRLSRGIGRLHSTFTIEHMPGAKIALINYFSQIPFEEAKKLFTYNEISVVANVLKKDEHSNTLLELNFWPYKDSIIITQFTHSKLDCIYCTTKYTC